MMIVRLGCLLSLLMIFDAASVVQARGVQGYSFETIYEKSTFVVIAHPLTKTAQTSERTTFESIETVERDGTNHAVAAAGVETKFEVLKVLKGNSQIKQFKLHHYIEDPLPGSAGVVVMDGPSTIEFDPEDPKRNGNFLLFLIKEVDGRYAPFGGQTDPGLTSVFALDYAM